MADISLKASHEYWSEFVDPSVYNVICKLESKEGLYFDGQEEYEKAMASLGDAIDLMSTESIKDLNGLLDVIAYTKTSRYLMILQSMDGVSPGSASKVIQAAERADANNRAAQFFLKRNVFFERYRLLIRLLSKERIALMQACLEG